MISNFLPEFLRRIKHELLIIVLGLSIPFGFMPYNMWWLVIPVMATFFYLCTGVSSGTAFLRTFIFGLVQFGLSYYWLVDIFQFSNFNIYTATFAVFLFIAYQAIFPALGVFLSVRFFPTGASTQLPFVIPAVWVLSEIIREKTLLGSPWSILGYTQIDSVIGNYAPIAGVYGVSYTLVVCSGLIALLTIRKNTRKPASIALLTILTVGWLLGKVTWVEPVGDQITVSLIQGNIVQQEKWKEDVLQSTLDLYQDKTSLELDSDLIVWPETAIPDSFDNVHDYLQKLEILAEQNKTDILVGGIEGDLFKGGYRNSLVSLRGGKYTKRHLIPFGEYYPWSDATNWLKRTMSFSVADFVPGPEIQPLIKVSGYEIGATICYELAYANEVLKSFPNAKLLVNVSNDAPFRDSPEPYLHHQVGRMRAKEVSRYIIRSSNTGFSGIIGPDGENVVLSTLNQREVVRGSIQPLSGLTPYAQWQDIPIEVLLISILMSVTFLNFVWREKNGQI